MFMDSCIMLGPCFTLLFGFSRHVSSCCLVPCGLQTMLEKTEVAVHAMSDAPEVTCGLLHDVFDIPRRPACEGNILGRRPSIPNYLLFMQCKWRAPLEPRRVSRLFSTGYHSRLALLCRWSAWRTKTQTQGPLPVCRPNQRGGRAWALHPWRLCNLPTFSHVTILVQSPRGIPGQVCTSVPMGIPISSGVAYDVSFDLHSAVLPVANLALWRVWLRPIPQGEPFDVAYRLRLPSSSLSAKGSSSLKPAVVQANPVGVCWIFPKFSNLVTHRPWLLGGSCA